MPAALPMCSGWIKACTPPASASVACRRLAGFERTFRFDYSYDGVDRHSGKLVLRGGQLIAFTGPQVASVRTLHPSKSDLNDGPDAQRISCARAWA